LTKFPLRNSRTLNILVFHCYYRTYSFSSDAN